MVEKEKEEEKDVTKLDHFLVHFFSILTLPSLLPPLSIYYFTTPSPLYLLTTRPPLPSLSPSSQNHCSLSFTIPSFLSFITFSPSFTISTLFLSTLCLLHQPLPHPPFFQLLSLFLLFPLYSFPPSLPHVSPLIPLLFLFPLFSP